MPLGFAQGRPRRANAVASLVSTGHLNPAGRRPFGGTAQHTHLPGPAARPGPALASVSAAATVGQRNAATKPVMHRVVQEARTKLQTERPRLPTVKFSAYQPGASGQDPWRRHQNESGEYFVTRVQEIWVYERQGDRWGTMEFFIFNPRTRTCVSFTPIGYIPAKARVQAIANSMGAFGRVYERFLAVTAATFVTGGLALEFEGGTAALAGARGGWCGAGNWEPPGLRS